MKYDAHPNRKGMFNRPGIAGVLLLPFAASEFITAQNLVGDDGNAL